MDIPRAERFRFHYTQQPLSYASTPYLLSHLLARGFQRAIFFKQESLVVGVCLSLLRPWDDRRSSSRRICWPRSPGPIGFNESSTFSSPGRSTSACSVSPERQRPIDSWRGGRIGSRPTAAMPCRRACTTSSGGSTSYPPFSRTSTSCAIRPTTWATGTCPIARLRCIRMPCSSMAARADSSASAATVPTILESITKYSQRLTWENVGPARELFDRARRKLEAAGYHETKRWPYAYGAFDNGVPVPDIARSLFLELGDKVEAFGDPLESASPDSYFHWLSEPADGSCDGPRVTRLWQAVYRARPDVRARSPTCLVPTATGFLHWTAILGVMPSIACPSGSVLRARRQPRPRHESRRRRNHRRQELPVVRARPGAIAESAASGGAVLRRSHR